MLSDREGTCHEIARCMLMQATFGRGKVNEAWEEADGDSWESKLAAIEDELDHGIKMRR